MEYICNYCNTSFGNHKTEYRNHRKTCKCKPVEYTCEFCGKKFNRAGVYTVHKGYQCTLNPDKKEQKHVCGFNVHNDKFGHKSKPGGWECPYCHEIFRTRRLFKEHNKQVHNTKRGTGIQDKSAILYCQFCHRDFYRLCSKNLHEKHCKLNPNGVKGASRLHSEETKKKISERRKKYLEEHPDKIPFVMYQHQTHKSYAETYFLDWLKKEGLFDKDEYRVGRYQLDFAWPNKKMYLEVDGNYHHTDIAKKHDSIRDEELKELGWKCVGRIDWSNYQKLLYHERKRFLLELKSKIISQ